MIPIEVRKHNDSQLDPSSGNHGVGVVEVKWVRRAGGREYGRTGGRKGVREPGEKFQVRHGSTSERLDVTIIEGRLWPLRASISARATHHKITASSPLYFKSNIPVKSLQWNSD